MTVTGLVLSPQRKATCLLQSANETESRNQFHKIQFESCGRLR
jgi:hypothetical protein